MACPEQNSLLAICRGFQGLSKGLIMVVVGKHFAFFLLWFSGKSPLNLKCIFVAPLPTSTKILARLTLIKQRLTAKRVQRTQLAGLIIHELSCARRSGLSMSDQ